MIWHKEPLDPAEVRGLAERYQCDNLTASILARRGVTDPEQLLYYLESEPSQLRSPFLFRDMEAAVDRIHLAIRRGERIFVFGDRDVDGISSTVLLTECISGLGGVASYGLPEGDDEYGLTEKWVRRIRDSGATLLVTVDCGVSSRREVALAAELGIDTVVTDHHNAPGELPACVAILNPKVEGSGYPFRELSGCGVAAKLDWALHYALTPAYGRTARLMTVHPANSSYTIDVAVVRNLTVLERVSETMVPGVAGSLPPRLSSLVGQGPLYVYNSGETAAMLASALEPVPELELEDLAPRLWKTFPDLEGKGLLRIMGSSDRERYRSAPRREIDVLVEMYHALLLHEAEEKLAAPVGRLDLAALGTLSDLMPLIDENRTMVLQGLERISSSPRSGLRELMASQNLLGRKLRARDVAWRISPILNAAGRMGAPLEALELFLCRSADEAMGRARALDELNRRRKSLGEGVWEEVRHEAGASLEQTDGRFVMVSSPRVHRGITGIIAARLASYFRVPAVVIAELEGRAVGSLRSPEGFSLEGLLERFDDLLSTYGGHDFAAGFSLPGERLAEFRERFCSVARELEPKQARAERIQVDAEIPSRYLTPRIAAVVDRFEPYGEGNPPLVFLTRGLRIESLEPIGRHGRPHVKLLLGAEKNRWPALYWNGAERVLASFRVHERVSVVYHVDRSHYMGSESLQLTVLDLAK